MRQHITIMQASLLLYASIQIYKYVCIQMLWPGRSGLIRMCAEIYTSTIDDEREGPHDECM
jgi:hypothetical protein